MVWSTAFAVVVVDHVWHVIVVTGRPRLWHCVHVLMAFGMIVMFLPTDRMLVSSGFGQVVFGLATIAVVGLLVSDLLRGGNPGGLWMVAVVNLAAMVYMSATARLEWLTVPFAVWLVLQAAGWATGSLYAAVRHGGLGTPDPQPARAALQGIAAARRTSTGPPGNQSKMEPAAHCHDTSISAHSSVICGTPTLTALGMAFMLVAMQFGTGVVGYLPGMPGM